jgi:hypothetical protein
MERNDFLEKVEVVVANRCVGEICDWRWPWPGDDRDEEDTCDNGAFDFVGQEDGGYESAAEDAHPHHWGTHLGGSRADSVNDVLSTTPCKLKRCGCGASNGTNSCTVREADDCYPVLTEPPEAK